MAHYYQSKISKASDKIVSYGPQISVVNLVMSEPLGSSQLEGLMTEAFA